MIVGVLGLGYWGPNLVRNFLAQKEVSKVIGCDIRDDRLKHIANRFPSVNLINDCDKLMNGEADIIVIATPVDSHYKASKKALESGKHIWVEKPFTSTSAQAEELIELAVRKNLKIFVDHTFIYNGAVRKMKELVENGELGNIIYFDSERVNLGLFQKDINVVWDLAPHDISILLFLIGKMPLSVRAEGMDFVQKGIEDDVHLTLKFPENIMAYMHVSWLDPLKIRKMTIVGNKKMLVYDDTEQTEKIKVYDKGVALEKSSLPKDRYYDTWEEFKLVYRSGDVLIPKLDSKEPLNAMCGHFIDCIKNG